MKLDTIIFRYSTGVVLLMCLFAFGCNQNVKVTGTVTYSDTGEPVMSGTVFFTGETEMGFGTIKDGKYSAGLLEDGGGIPPGTYTIASNSIFVPPREAISMIGPDGTPIQLSGAVDSSNQELYYTKEPQTIEIKKSMTYDFQVERGTRQ